MLAVYLSIKSCMKELRGSGTWCIITNKKVSFFIFSTIGNNSKTLGRSITFMMFVLLTLQHRAKPCCVVYFHECLSSHPGFH